MLRLQSGARRILCAMAIRGPKWLIIAALVTAAPDTPGVFELWDDDAFAALATRAVRLARQTGALTMLGVLLPYLAGVYVFAAQLDVAAALVQEADAITVATGNAGLVYAALVHGAWRGVVIIALLAEIFPWRWYVDLQASLKCKKI